MIALLPPDLQERVKISDEDFKRVIELDHAFMADRRAEWTDCWNPIIAGG